MANKQFTKHAQRELNKNPNVVKCTASKISFTEEFALKVVDALKKGEDPYKVFTDNGLSIRILGKSRINGTIGLWRSKYELEDLPRRKPQVKEKEVKETAAERRENNLQAAIKKCDDLIANYKSLSLPTDTDIKTVKLAAIKSVSDNDKKVFVKDLCFHYGFSYSEYYNYLKSTRTNTDEYDNVLNSHRKK